MTRELTPDNKRFKDVLFIYESLYTRDLQASVPCHLDSRVATEEQLINVS